MRKLIATFAGLGLGLCLSTSAWACNTAGGEVTQIDAKSGTLVMNKTCCGGSEELKFAVKKEAKVTVNGKDATLADLRTGDKIKIDYEKTDQVLSIKVTRDS